MLIACPYCGPRDVSEFTYTGDANRTRPNPMSQDIDAWNEYIYDRVNIAGNQNEYWQHSGGCREHLFVVRNTLTHEISQVRSVRLSRVSARVSKATQVALAAKPKKVPAAKGSPATTAPKGAKAGAKSSAKSRGAKQ